MANTIPVKPCIRCGSQDRLKPRAGKSVGPCRPCTQQYRQQWLTERAKRPCKRCGRLDWNESGNCRTCQTNAGQALAEAKQPCRNCGGKNRGPHGECRDCSRKNLVESRLARMDDPCNICGALEKTPSGVCLPCNRRRRREHPERFRALDAARRARVLNAGPSYTPDELRAQFEAQKGTCHWCHKKVGKRRSSWHADHVIPLTAGGTNDISNIVVSCARCNLQKNKQMPWEFAGRLF